MVGGGGHLHFGLIPKFPRIFDWKASLIDYDFLQLELGQAVPLTSSFTYGLLNYDYLQFELGHAVPDFLFHIAAAADGTLFLSDMIQGL